MKMFTCVILSSFLLSGCSTFRSSTQELTIKCNPDNAILLINGEKHFGSTVIHMPRDIPISIKCYKDGYHPFSHRINTHWNGTAIFDFIGGLAWGVPAFGLISSGAYSLDQTELSIELAKIGEENDL